MNCNSLTTYTDYLQFHQFIAACLQTHAQFYLTSAPKKLLNYLLITYIYVTDINECGLSDNVCGNGTCENTAGRFICHCLPGFESTMMMQVCMGRYNVNTLLHYFSCH